MENTLSTEKIEHCLISVRDIITSDDYLPIHRILNNTSIIWMVCSILSLNDRSITVHNLKVNLLQIY